MRRMAAQEHEQEGLEGWRAAVRPPVELAAVIPGQARERQVQPERAALVPVGHPEQVPVALRRLERAALR